MRELNALGFKVQPNHGTYFLMADFRALSSPDKPESDTGFAMRLTKEAGVTVIPVRACWAQQPCAHLAVRMYCTHAAAARQVHDSGLSGPRSRIWLLRHGHCEVGLF